jgi:predicted permease
MSLISVALSLVAVGLMLAQVRRRVVLAAWVGGLALGLYLLPDPAKVAAPLAAILTLGLRDSVESLRPR